MTQDRQVKIVVAADVAAAIRGLNEVSNAAGNVASSSSGAAAETKSAWDTFKESVAGQVAIGDLISKGVSGAFGAVIDGAKNMVAAGLSYEQSMNTLSAVTGANDTQMRSLGDAAKQLGNDITIPGASAGSAAAAMAELAKGGLTVDQTMQAASGTLRLAAAAQIDGAEAAQIQANALNAFRLGADQADHVADVLANSANAASGEITDMAAALQQSATVAAGFGISVDDSATTLALFAKNGVLGSDAGTSFKTMLTALASPTDAQAGALEELNLQVYDAAGNFVGMESVTQQLSAAHGRLTTEQYNSAASTAFGTDAIRAANILGQEGTKGWQDMAAAVGQAGGAQELAAAQSQGLTGALDRFKNSAENAALTLYEQVSPALSSLADFGATAFSWIGDAIGWFSELPGPVRNTALALGAVVLLRGPLAAIGPAISRWIGTAVLNFNALYVAIRTSTFSMATFGAAAKGALAALGGPIGLAIVGVTTALSFMGSTTDDVATSTASFGEAIDENTGKLKDNADAIIAKAAADAGSFDAIEAIGGTVTDYTQALLGNEEAQERIHTLLLDQAEIALRNSDAWGQMVAKGQAIPGEARKMASGFLASGDAGAYASEQFDAVLNASARFAADSDNLTSAQRQTQQAIEASGTAAGSAAGNVDLLAGATQQAEQTATPFTDALKDMRAAAQEADAATQFLITSLDLMDDGSISAEQATRQNAAALREISSSARDYAEAQQKVADKEAELADLSAHLGTEYKGRVVTQADLDRASRELAEAQDGVANASDRQFNANLKAAESAKTLTGEAYNNAVAQGDMKGAVEAAVAKMAEQRQSFIDNQVAAGMERDAAEKLADQLNLIPANVRTTYEQFGLEDAISRSAALNAELDKTNNRTVRYTVVGTQIYQYQTTSQGTANSAEPPGHADGGWVSGMGGPTDDMVPARLSPGEFVVRAAQAQKNRGLLEAINKGVLGFAAGGSVPGGAAAGDGESQEVSATLTAPDPELFQKSWDQIVASTETAWGSGIAPTLDLLSQGNTKTGAEFTQLDEDVVAPVWANISENVQGAWDGTILPTYDALNAGTETGGVWQNWLRDLTAQAWQQNQASVGNATNWLTGVTFPTLNAGAQGVGAEQTNLAATTSGAWGQIGSVIQSTYDGQIVPAWTGVKSFTTEMGGFFEGVRSGVSSATGQATSDISKIKSAIQDFFNLVNAQVASAPGRAEGGPVTEGLPTFAVGGPITMGTGPKSDDVLIRVSRGEYVVNAEATSKHRDTLDAINYNRMPGFAAGGLIGDKIKAPVESHLIAGVHRAMDAGVSKALAAFPTGFGGTVIYNGNITVNGISAPLPAGQRGEFVKAVASQMGTSYSWGGASPPLFDCSGLMSWGLNQAGRGVGRLTAEGFNSGYPHISPEKPGDLVTFDTGRLAGGKAGHIGMVFHPGQKIMLHTDGAGPARAGDYASRGGLLGFVDPIGGSVGFAPQDTGGDPPAGGWLGSILSKIKQGGSAAAAPANYSPTGGVEQWRALGLDVLGQVGAYRGMNLLPFIGHMLNQIRSESGGDPNAINKIDSNWQRGDPSIGLLQVIGQTFRNALSGTPFANLIGAGQRDPRASLTASTLYSLNRYGTLDRAWRGVAYDTGGIWPDGTAGWNTSGGPEMVLKPWQWAAAQSAIQQVTNQANRTYQGGQHGGVQIGTIVNNTGSDLKRELQYAAVCARG